MGCVFVWGSNCFSCRFQKDIVIYMNERVETIKYFTQFGFDRLDRNMNGFTEEELDWIPCPEANSPRWMLTHLAEQWNVYIPRIMRGDPDFWPDDWPEDYIGNESYGLERIMEDLETGKLRMMEGLEDLEDDDLDEEIPFFGGTRKRMYALMLLISEIFHHVGQIAHARGMYRRLEN
jgi:hypothetical protein